MSSFSDLLGTESTSLNKKIKAGEENCKDRLRAEAIAFGGNAIIGTDIDYSDIGSRGMLMVCMSGTAVKLNNLDVFPESRRAAISLVSESVNKFNELMKYKNHFQKYQ